MNDFHRPTGGLMPGDLWIVGASAQDHLPNGRRFMIGLKRRSLRIVRSGAGGLKLAWVTDLENGGRMFEFVHPVLAFEESPAEPRREITDQEFRAAFMMVGGFYFWVCALMAQGGWAAVLVGAMLYLPSFSYLNERYGTDGR